MVPMIAFAVPSAVCAAASGIGPGGGVLGDQPQGAGHP